MWKFPPVWQQRRVRSFHLHRIKSESKTSETVQQKNHLLWTACPLISEMTVERFTCVSVTPPRAPVASDCGVSSASCFTFAPRTCRDARRWQPQTLHESQRMSPPPLPATDDFQVLAAMQHMCTVAEQQRGRRAQPALPLSALATDEMQSQPCRRGRKTCSRGPLMTFCTAEPRPCAPARMFRLSL